MRDWLEQVKGPSSGVRNQQYKLGLQNTKMTRLHQVVALCLCCCALVATGTVAAKAPPEVEKHFQAGIAYYDDPSGPKYEEAYREFLTAYQIYPSYHLLANIGTCALYLERDAEAIDAYERYLQKATATDIKPRKRAQMETDVKTLKASLVQLVISASPQKLTLIDERFASKGQVITNRYEVSNGKISLGIHPGNHRLTAHLEGYEDQRWEFDAAPSSSHSHEFNLALTVREQPLKVVPNTNPENSKTRNGGAEGTVITKDRQDSRSTPTSVYVGLAATGLLGAAAGVTGAMAWSSRKQYIEKNDADHIDEARKLQHETKRDMLISDITLGAAAVAGGVTLYLYLTRTGAHERQATEKRTSVRLEPSFNATAARISVVGNF
jgi:tetratricopeptide (TPR) repeat protein